MTHNFYFTRLYKRARFEGQAIPNSIIVFRKQPYEQKSYKRSATGMSYVSKYTYGLFIDLWLVRIKLMWLGRTLKEPE